MMRVALRRYLLLLLALLIAGVLLPSDGVVASHRIHPTVSTASTWYISPNGTDQAGCGTASGTSACASLQYLTQNYLRGQSIAAPGNVIIFTAGTYGPQSCAHFNDVQSGMQFVRDQAVQTTIEASGPVTITRPTDPSITVQTTPLWFMQQCYDIKYTGFTITGMRGRPDENYGASPGTYNRISVVGRGEFYIADTDGQTDGSIVQNVTIRDAAGVCLKVDGGDTNQYLNNTLTTCGQPGNNYDDGAYIHGSNTVVSGNVVSGSTGACLGVYGQGTGDTVSNNTVSNCGAGGILSNNPRMSISGNTAYGNGTGIFSQGTGSWIVQNTVYGNTLDYTSACVDAATFAGCGFGAPLQTTGWWGAVSIARVSVNGTTQMWQLSQTLNSIRRWTVTGTDASGITPIAGDLTGNGMGRSSAMASITVNGSPEVWVLNYNDTISRFHPNGTAIGVFGVVNNDPHLNHPTGLAQDGTNVYITDTNSSAMVHVYSVATSTPTWTADLTNPNLSNPQGLAVIPLSGGGSDLWVVNGNSTIVRVNESTGATDGVVLAPRTDAGAQPGTCAAGSADFLGTGAIAWFGGRVWIGSVRGFITYTNDGTFQDTYMNGTAWCSSLTRVQGMMDTGSDPERISIDTAGSGATPPLGLAVFGSQMWTAQSGGSQTNSRAPTGIYALGEGATIANNTLYQNGATELDINQATTTGPIVENNIVSGSSTTHDAPSTYAPTNLGGTGAVWDYNDIWNTEPVTSGGTHSMSRNPLFTNPAAHTFTLSYYSPCRRTGTPIPGLALNTPPDMGAIQFRLSYRAAVTRPESAL